MKRRKMLQLSLLGITGMAHAGTIPRILKKGVPMNTESEVAIIGGGPAGLTAALALGRIGKKVLIFDDNKGRNFPAHHMMNFPSRDGTPPREFKEMIIKDLRKYSEVALRQETVNDIQIRKNSFIINGKFEVKLVLLAHGIHDVLPDIPGIRDLWGRSVFHCPYCHGHEFKRQKIGVMESDSKYLSHMVPLLLSLSGDVTIFTNNANPEIPTQLLKKTKLVTSKVREITHDGHNLEAVVTEEGRFEIDGLVIKPPQILTTDIGTKLGCELNEFGLYKTDSMGMTTVPGIYAAGDIVETRQAVILACASGMKTAASMTFALMND